MMKPVSNFHYVIPNATIRQALATPARAIRRKSVRRPRFVFTGLVAVFGLAMSASGQTRDADELERCRAIVDVMERARCFQSMSTPDLPQAPIAAPPPSAPTIGGWRLVQSRNPQGGADAISITRPGELASSDPDFVGLMIRCADAGIETLLVTLTARPLRSRVTVTVNGQRTEGTVTAPGLAILMAPAVAEAARTNWRSLREVAFEIDDGASRTRGRVLLDDYEPALAALSSACAVRSKAR